MDPFEADVAALLRERPEASEEAVARVRSGEPLAYVIGDIPFLGLTIGLSSRPLIPRPETEWWTEELIKQILNRSTIYGTAQKQLRVLDLCAGSGAVGLAVLKHCPAARVSFGELVPEHARLIEENLAKNALDASRADIRAGDLFAPFAGERFDIIATNPPYLSEGREVAESVSKYEPSQALFAGIAGLDVIARIAEEAPEHLRGGELWMECDIENIEEAKRLVDAGGARESAIRTDQYGRPRLVVAYY